jgi:hypothetical protein
MRNSLLLIAQLEKARLEGNLTGPAGACSCEMKRISHHSQFLEHGMWKVSTLEVRQVGGELLHMW